MWPHSGVVRRRATGRRRTAVQFAHRRDQDGRHSRRHTRAGLAPSGAGRGVQGGTVRCAAGRHATLRAAAGVATVEGHQVGGHVRRGLPAGKD